MQVFCLSGPGGIDISILKFLFASSFSLFWVKTVASVSSFEKTNESLSMMEISGEKKSIVFSREILLALSEIYFGNGGKVLFHH